MPTWGEILKEVSSSNDPTICDDVRRRYLRELSRHSKRNVILYSTRWTITPLPDDQQTISINDEDIQALMEVIHGIDGNLGLDLIIHSPGGSPDSAEAILKYLRKKFSYIRAIIPQAAMSAATMLACGCDEIVMGKHSYLGPIDPQMIIPMSTGNTPAMQMVPAQAILDQFDMAKEECKDPTNLTVWYPILPIYGPSLLKECISAQKRAESLVKEWLAMYMFKDHPDKELLSDEISKFLGAHDKHLSHGRHIDRDEAKMHGIIIRDLEDDQKLQDLVLSIHHATSITFNRTPAIKIVENHIGKAYIKQQMILKFEQQSEQMPSKYRDKKMKKK